MNKMIKMKSNNFYIGIFALVVVAMYFLFERAEQYTEPLKAPLRFRDMLPATISQQDRNLLRNPIYKKFNIIPPGRKKVVNVIISIQTAPFARKRRASVRNTWYKECAKVDKIVPECMFFTDIIDETSKYYKDLTEEAQKYGDIKFQNTPKGGLNFAMRLLYQMVYFSIHYEFDYFMRIDDDYYLCLNRFLKELPYPMEKNFVWSFVHCYKDIVNPDEGIIVLSRDITRAYLNQAPDRMLCTGYGSTAISYWTMELKLNHIFLHDNRIRFYNFSPFGLNNICQRFVAVHRVLPSVMKNMWKNRGNITISGNLKTNSKVCSHYHTFNWRKMKPETKNGSRPVPCISNPVFPDKHRSLIRLE